MYVSAFHELAGAERNYPSGEPKENRDRKKGMPGSGTPKTRCEERLGQFEARDRSLMVKPRMTSLRTVWARSLSGSPQCPGGIMSSHAKTSVALLALSMCATGSAFAGARVFLSKHSENREARSFQNCRGCAGRDPRRTRPYPPAGSDGIFNQRLANDLAAFVASQPGWTALMLPSVPLGAHAANEISVSCTWRSTTIEHVPYPCAFDTSFAARRPDCAAPSIVMFMVVCSPAKCMRRSAVATCGYSAPTSPGA